MHEGAAIRVPGIFGPIIKFICPAFLLVIFTMWVLVNVFGVSFTGGPSEISSYVKDLFIEPNKIAWLSVSIVMVFAIFLALLIGRAKAYKDIQKLKD
jgi:hypothetical protein